SIAAMAVSRCLEARSSFRSARGRWVYPLDRQKSRNGVLVTIRSERGSVSLEAVLMFPAFLTFVLIFVICIRIVLVETVLQSVANDTVKQLSGIWIPFEQQLRQADGLIGRLDH